MSNTAPSPAQQDADQDNQYTRANRIHDLIEMTQALSNIFTKENALLSSQRVSAIAPLQAEKSRLAVAYATAIREMAQDRHLAGGVDDQLLETLRELTARFNALANDQRNLLTGVAGAHEGVVQAVASAASYAPVRINEQA